MVVKSRFLVVSALVLAVDQWTKLWVEAAIGPYGRVPVLPGFLDLVHYQNTGIAFGLFPAGRELAGTLLLAGLGLVALAVVVSLFRRTPDDEPVLLLALSLVLGGALGNLADRFLLRAVTDFLDVYVGSYHWPAFNVADSGVTVGIVLMLAHSFVPALQGPVRPGAVHQEQGGEPGAGEAGLASAGRPG